MSEEIIKESGQDMTFQTSSLETVQDTLERFIDTANVEAVYGEPVNYGETLVIPTAEVLCGMGFGVASGRGRSSEDDAEHDESEGGGGGGGGRVLSRPVAVVVASPEGVRVEPVVDFTKIGLAALTAAGFMLGMLARMMRGPDK